MSAPFKDGNRDVIDAPLAGTMGDFKIIAASMNYKGDPVFDANGNKMSFAGHDADGTLTKRPGEDSYAELAQADKRLKVSEHGLSVGRDTSWGENGESVSTPRNPPWRKARRRRRSTASSPMHEYQIWQVRCGRQARLTFFLAPRDNNALVVPQETVKLADPEGGVAKCEDRRLDQGAHLRLSGENDAPSGFTIKEISVERPCVGTPAG